MANPELYARSNPFQIRDATQVLSVYKTKMNPEDTDKVLDIGCGTGDVTLKVLVPSIERFEVLFGVDKSTAMVQYAREKNFLGKIQYEVLDIARHDDVKFFTEAWGPFSKIYTFYCLHWIKDLRKALRNIRYLMKPGGKCLLVFVAQCPVFEMYRRMADVPQWKEYMVNVNDYIPETQTMAQPSFAFSQMMEDAGISTVECETQHRSFAFASTKLLKDCVVAINPFLETVPQSLKDDFIDDCLMTLEEINRESGPVNQNESCCFSYKLLVAQGTANNLPSEGEN